MDNPVSHQRNTVLPNKLVKVDEVYVFVTYILPCLILLQQLLEPTVRTVLLRVLVYLQLFEGVVTAITWDVDDTSMRVRAEDTSCPYPALELVSLCTQVHY